MRAGISEAAVKRTARFVAFREFLLRTFHLAPREEQRGAPAPYVLDVAGGKGDTAALLGAAGIQCGIVDPSAAGLNRAAMERLVATHLGNEAPAADRIVAPDLFTELFAADATHDSPGLAAAKSRATLVLGFHPDQAAEPVVTYALATGTPFAVVPCCVFPRDFPHRRVLEAGGRDGRERQVSVESHEQFVRYLLAKAAPGMIQRAQLPFDGHNTVLFWSGPAPPRRPGERREKRKRR